MAKYNIEATNLERLLVLSEPPISTQLHARWALIPFRYRVDAWKMSLEYILLFWFSLDCVLCSIGDRSNDFRSCTGQCHSLSCGNPSHELPFALRLTGWTCLEDCQYQCMHQVTAEDVRLQRPVRQFFGKVCLDWEGNITGEYSV